METFTLEQWLTRRAASLLGERLRTAASMIPLAEVLSVPGIAAVKLITSGTAFALPTRPKPSQIEGLAGTQLGAALDVFDEAFQIQSELNVADRRALFDWYKMFMTGPGGGVVVPPAFFGADP